MEANNKKQNTCSLVTRSRMCLIKHEGIDYKSAEHFYSAEMARFHDRLDLIDDILDARDGYATKRIVRSIKVKAKWHEHKIEVMKKIINRKFDQNDSLRDRLLKTKGELYEATKTDLDFACGAYTFSGQRHLKKQYPWKKHSWGNIMYLQRQHNWNGLTIANCIYFIPEIV